MKRFANINLTISIPYYNTSECSTCEDSEHSSEETEEETEETETEGTETETSSATSSCVSSIGIIDAEMNARYNKHLKSMVGIRIPFPFELDIDYKSLLSDIGETEHTIKNDINMVQMAIEEFDYLCTDMEGLMIDLNILANLDVCLNKLNKESDTYREGKKLIKKYIKKLYVWLDEINDKYDMI